jgi:hypothetical protein
VKKCRFVISTELALKNLSFRTRISDDCDVGIHFRSPRKLRESISSHVPDGMFSNDFSSPAIPAGGWQASGCIADHRSAKGNFGQVQPFDTKTVASAKIVGTSGEKRDVRVASSDGGETFAVGVVMFKCSQDSSLRSE